VIYLANTATTQPRPAAVEAAQAAMQSLWANPSSVHRVGQDTRQAIELARAQVATLLRVKPRDITFTAGATESIDIAHRGVFASFQGARPLIVTTPIEHEAVREVCADLRDTQQAQILELDVNQQGEISLDHLRDTLVEHQADIALVSIQWANNETGTIQPVREIGQLCRTHGVLFLSLIHISEPTRPY